MSEENSFSNIYKVTIQIDMLATMVREYDQLGLCWNKQGMPTIEDDHLIVDITSNKAVFEIENLEQGSLYYAKTFASVNGTGYIYGEEMEFSTLSTSEVYPDFDDIIFSEYNLNSIKISANVTEKTDYPITEISVSLYTFEDDIYTEVKNKKISVEGLSKGIIFEELTKNTMYLAKTITLVNENILYSDYNEFSTLSDADVSPSFGAIAFSDINLTSATVNISITKKSDFDILDSGIEIYTDSLGDYTDITSQVFIVKYLDNSFTIKNLDENSTYHIRAFAKVGNQTYYDKNEPDQKENYTQFKTLSDADVSPSFGAIAFSDIKFTSAIATVNITKKSDFDISDSGIEIYTDSLGDYTDITSQLSLTGNTDIGVTIDGLNKNTIYYARAFAQVGSETYNGVYYSFKTNKGESNTYTGDLYIKNMEDVEAFNYTDITGHLYIGKDAAVDAGTPITDISKISDMIVNIGGGLEISDEDNQLTSIPDFPLLENIGESNSSSFLKIQDCNSLTSMGEFPKLNTGLRPFYIWILNNPMLENISSFLGVTKVKAIQIVNNDSLTYIDFQNLTSIDGGFYISENDSLLSLSGFNNLVTLKYYLNIYKNISLRTMTGFQNLVDIIGGDSAFSITHNYSLERIDNFTKLQNTGLFYIDNNTALESIGNFTSLLTVGKSLRIFGNNKLTTIDGFSNIPEIGHYLGIYSNPELTTIGDFTALTKVGYLMEEAYPDSFRIENNPKLTNIGNFNSMTKVYNQFKLIDNTSLINLNSFDGLNTVEDNIIITGNTSLDNLCTFKTIFTTGSILGTSTMSNNGVSAPTITQIQEGFCN
ncbi:MAG: hypothetical protein HRT66_07045 [Flavobacteriaceae bacterium]|nr:hypothetical protein [Flavobacteriaceae bacterium]